MPHARAPWTDNTRGYVRMRRGRTLTSQTIDQEGIIASQPERIPKSSMEIDRGRAAGTESGTGGKALATEAWRGSLRSTPHVQPVKCQAAESVID
jgi:hypothetical protein